jgi:hypothetical protein
MTDKQKHLEFIQNAITRMAGNSFRLKVWTVLLVSALFAFFASFGETGYVFIMIVPIAAFWILDGFLLSQECLFRSLYDRVREEDESEIDYSMDTGELRGEPRNGWHNSTVSRTLLVFCGVLSGVALLAACWTSGRVISRLDDGCRKS